MSVSRRAAAFIALIRLGALFALGMATTPEIQETAMGTNQKMVRVAICQTLCIDSDREGNFRRIEYALESAAKQGAQLACLPETAILGWVNPEAHKLADPIPGPTSERITDLARKHNLMICIGLAEKAGGQLYDSVILVGPDGEILAKHRKINILTELMDPPYTPGKREDIRVVDTPLGRVGLLICADTFKDELVQAAGEQSPDLLLVPYGWAADKSEWPQHAERLAAWVSATAKRAGCPVVGTDLVGRITSGPWTGKTYGGQSVVADREGNVLTILRDRDVEVRVIDLEIGRATSGPSQTKPRP
jgi:predicted amidohydrolase